MIRVIIGIVLLLAAVGNDCDGACIERAWSFPQLLFATFAGFGFIVWPMVDGTFNEQ